MSAPVYGYIDLPDFGPLYLALAEDDEVLIYGELALTWHGSMGNRYQWLNDTGTVIRVNRVVTGDGESLCTLNDYTLQPGDTVNVKIQAVQVQGEPNAAFVIGGIGLKQGHKLIRPQRGA